MKFLQYLRANFVFFGKKYFIIDIKTYIHRRGAGSAEMGDFFFAVDPACSGTGTPAKKNRSTILVV